MQAAVSANIAKTRLREPTTERDRSFRINISSCTSNMAGANVSEYVRDLSSLYLERPRLVPTMPHLIRLADWACSFVEMRNDAPNIPNWKIT